MTPDLSVRTTSLISTRIDSRIWRTIRQTAIEQGRTIQLCCEEAFVSWLARQGVTLAILADPVEKARIEKIVVETMTNAQIARKYGPRKNKAKADLTAAVEAVAPGTTGDLSHGVAGAGDGSGGSNAGTAPPPAAPPVSDRSALLHGFTEEINDGDPELMAERLARGELVAPNRGTPDPDLGF